MYQIALDNELIIDNFAGGGGASCGIEAALQRPVNIAVNHDPEAVGMHMANHPLTKHFCEDVWKIVPRDVCAGRRVALAWFSPDCKHFSKAKGGKPVEKKIRGLAWVVLKWASLTPELGKPRIIFLENVEEFLTWGPLLPNGMPDPKNKGRTFESFKNALRRHGYTQIECKESRASDYGAGTIRKRLMLIARCDGQPVIWPKPTHGDPKKHKDLKPWVTAAECIDWSLPSPSIFERKKSLAENTLKRIAKGMKKFVIEADEPFILNITHGGRVEPINEPLRTITCAKRGEKALIVPSIVGVGGRAGQSRPRGGDEPIATVTAKADAAICSAVLIGAGGPARAGEPRPVDRPLNTPLARNNTHVCSAFLVGAGGPAYSGKPTSIEQPMGTLMAENHKQLCTAFLIKHFGGVTGVRVDTPLPTITTRGTQTQILTSHIMKMRGHSDREKHGQPSTEPLHTVSAGGQHHAHINAFLIKYFGTDQDPQLNEPLHTVTTKDRFAIVQVESTATDNMTEEQRYNAWWTIRFLEDYGAIPTMKEPGIPRPSFLMLGDYIMYDICMRMMAPRELFTAQGFPQSYIIDRTAEGKPLTKTAQVRMCGNSVSPPWAEAHVAANVPESAIYDGSIAAAV